MISKFLTSVVVGCAVYFSSLESFPGDEIKKHEMLYDLDVIKHVLDVCYAPAAWKKLYSKWNLEEAIYLAKEQILNEKMTTKHFQQIVNRVLNTAGDYHVKVFFVSTASATLPFSVKRVDGHYYVDWIDFSSLAFNCPFNIGDEIIYFNGQPVKTVVEQLQLTAGLQSNPQTDQSLSAITLTNRLGKRGDEVPRGPITIIFKSALDGSVGSYQFMWEYESELISNPLDNLSNELHSSFSVLSKKEQQQKKIEKRSMLSPMYELYRHSSNDKENPGGLGAYKSFLPELGEIIWEEEDLPFYTYIYKNNQGKYIGYIRIAHYTGDDNDARIFGKIMEMFEQTTDALVIDQLNNPGGFALYKYSLASHLTDYPLITPKHRISLTQKDVLEAYAGLDFLQEIRSDSDAEMALGGNFNFNDYNYVLFLREFYEFLINEWNAGRALTRPTYIDGVDHINPHSKFRYTKPILVLINELDFSGGDFFPAVLQDNKRAVLFGTRTAGAGGCVLTFSFPNLNGIQKISYTSSIAERLNGEPLENLGVKPDIEYQVTKEDVQNGYKSYIRAVNQSVNKLLK